MNADYYIVADSRGNFLGTSGSLCKRLDKARLFATPEEACEAGYALDRKVWRVLYVRSVADQTYRDKKA